MFRDQPKRWTPPHIAPLAEGTPRPFWSVMIPTHNCATYLAATLRSVLTQAPDAAEMQIEVVDDHSMTDDPEAVVNELGAGRVQYYRQPQNVGISANFNTCVRRARGQWVHILHGDDLVLPGFYDNYRRVIDRNPQSTIVVGPSIIINDRGETVGRNQALAAEEGPVHDFLLQQVVVNHVLTPTVVVRRTVYERAGGFMENVSHTTDWEMWSRAALLGAVVTLTTPVTQYRVHSGSDTARLILSGRNIKEYVETIKRLLHSLPRDLRRQLTVPPYETIARIALQTSQDLGSKFHWKGAFLQSLWALRLQPNRTTLHWTGKALFHYAWQTVKPFLSPRSSGLPT